MSYMHQRSAARSAMSRMAAACLWVFLMFHQANAVAVDDPLCVNTASTPITLPLIDGRIAGDQGYEMAAQYVFNNGVSNADAIVQVAKIGTKLYFTFDVRNDPVFSDEDVIIILLGPEVGNAAKDWRIHVNPVSASGGQTTPGTGPANLPVRVDVWKDSTSWAANFGTIFATDPAWINAKVVASDPAVTPVGYRVEMAIDLTAAGITFPAGATGFKLHFNALRHYEGVDQFGNAKSFIAGQLNWPSTALIPGSPNNSPGLATLFGNPQRPAWGDVNFDGNFPQTGTPTGCNGIRITRVWLNNDPNNHNTLNRPQPGGSASTEYRIEIENNSANSAGHILATVNAGIFGITPFSTFGPLPAGQVSPSQPLQSWSSASPGAIAPNMLKTLGPLTWTYTYQQMQTLLNQSPYVCSLVQLDVDTAHMAGVPRTLIANRYFYWNTHFAYASAFKHSAVLDTRGFTKTLDPSGMQQLHLVTSTRVLPSRRDDGPVRGEKRFARMDFKDARGELQLVNALKHYEAGSSFFANTVCGFRSTGRYVTLGKKTAELMERTPCYGYWIAHREGRDEAWRHVLSGKGVKNISPNLYSVAVPDGRMTLLDTLIEAVDECACKERDLACQRRCYLPRPGR